MDTRYIEIPLDYSVFLREPITTQNVAGDNLSRLLVGRASDPDFGDLEAKAYFNYSPPINTEYPTAAATFKSLVLQLKFDYYVFGAKDSSDLQLEVHEVLEQLTPERIYYSGTTISYDPTIVGDTTIALGPLEVADNWAKYVDNDATNNTYFTLKIQLSDAIGISLLNDLVNNRLVFDDFNEFSTKYPGFAITMPVGNKILGFTPVYSLPTPTSVDSKLVLNYQEGTTSVAVDFPIYYSTTNNEINPVVNFTYLEPNRSGSPLDGLIPFEDLVPTDNNIYVQSGTGIMAKFDLTKVYQYFDTVEFPVINSAQFELENTYTGRAPQRFELLLLDSLNQYRGIYLDTVVNGIGGQYPDPYLAKIQPGVVPLSVGTGSETRVALFNEITNSETSVDQVNGKIGLSYYTEFFQQIITHKDNKRRAKAFAIHPVDDEFFKTVSVLKLSPSSAKLKIFYSKPLTSLP